MLKIAAPLNIILFVLSCNSFGQIRSSNDLIGVWTANQVRVEFIDRSKITVILPGGTKQSGEYRGDFFHSPVLLEMFFNDGNSKVEFKCLVESVQPNAIRWQLFEKTANPRHFSGTYFTLVKTKN